MEKTIFRIHFECDPLKFSAKFCSNFHDRFKSNFVNFTISILMNEIHDLGLFNAMIRDVDSSQFFGGALFGHKLWGSIKFKKNTYSIPHTIIF